MPEQKHVGVLVIDGGYVTIAPPARIAEGAVELWEEALTASATGAAVSGRGVHIPVGMAEECEVSVELEDGVARRIIIELG